MIEPSHTIGNGKFLNQYRRITSIGDDDLVVMAKGGVETNAIRFGDLKQCIYDHLSYSLSVGSMAFKRKFFFSEAVHDHGTAYNKLEYRSRYSYTDETASEYDVLGSLEIGSSNETQEIISPKVYVAEQELPPIGMVKFVYSPKAHFRGLSGINSEDFNGWIVPDGQRIRVSEISNSSYQWTDHIYYNNEYGTLDIPLISNFIRMEPFKTQEINTIVPFVNDIPPHEHSMYEISCDLTCDMSSSQGDVRIPLIGSSSTQKDGLFYCGEESQLTSETISATVKFPTDGATVEFMTYTDENSVPKETYPSYDLVPVIVYIGGARSK